MTSKEKNYTLPIIMMFALFFMISFVTGLQNPMGIIVKNQFGASNFMSQLGNAANFIAYAFMGIPAGILLQKIGYKKTALLAIIIGFLGVGIQYLSGGMESFATYLTGAFVSGFSMCMLNTVVNPMLNTLGGGGKKGNILLQLGGSINSIGATIVPVLVGYLIGNASRATIKEANPALFLAMGIFILAFLVLLFVKIPEPYLDKKEKVKSKYSAFSFRHFCLGVIAIFIYVGIEVGIPNTANLYMTSDTDKGGLGIDTTIAGTVVGTYWFLMLIGRLIGASLGARVSSKAMLTFTSSLGLIFILLAIISPISTTVSMPVFKSDISLGFAKLPITIVFFILCGLCTSVMWGGIFNLAVEGLGKFTSAASGIFMMMVCGGGILPLIQNYFADLTGFLSSFWLVIIEFAFILYYALIGSKNVNKNIPVD
ncbi:MFS transporter [Apibacter adventoris]|uniref:MFS transporter n=2 Tax=Apibacter adventoris TaxID=1679466 RepID=A0A2S8A8D1_9FLAO|nr:MFS transporter [Apibacter adventoris]